MRIKSFDISKIDEKISFVKNVEIKSLNNEINFDTQKIKEYQLSLIKNSDKKINGETQNILAAMNLTNIRNLILDLQTRIENLKKKKRTLMDIKLKDLEERKRTLLTDNIDSLNLKLKIDIVNKISNIKHKIKEEKLKLGSNNIKNTQIVGDIIVNDNPLKPKKALIIVVAFITSLILSIFLVFLFEFIKSFKEEEKVTNE